MSTEQTIAMEWPAGSAAATLDRRQLWLARPGPARQWAVRQPPTGQILPASIAIVSYCPAVPLQRAASPDGNGNQQGEPIKPITRGSDVGCHCCAVPRRLSDLF